MGKFDGILICSDLDHTLAAHSRAGYMEPSFSQKDVEAIRYFQSEGGYFTVISGRHPSVVRELMGDAVVSNAPIGGYNGALLQNTDGTPFYSGGTKGDSMIRLAQKLWDSDLGLCFLSLHISGRRTLKCSRLEEGEEFFDQPLDMQRMLPFDTYNMVLSVAEGQGATLCRRVQRFLDDTLTYTRPVERTVEISLREDTKGAALLRIKKAVGARLTVAMGDYENDIEMLRASDIGYAVGNACKALKDVADRVTVPCTEGAAAAVIAELEKDYT